MKIINKNVRDLIVRFEFREIGHVELRRNICVKYPITGCQLKPIKPFKPFF